MQLVDSTVTMYVPFGSPTKVCEGFPNVPICCVPLLPQSDIIKLGSELSPLSTTTCIDPSFCEQKEGVVFTATVENEFGVNIVTGSYMVESPASVTKNE